MQNVLPKRFFNAHKTQPEHDRLFNSGLGSKRLILMRDLFRR